MNFLSSMDPFQIAGVVVAGGIFTFIIVRVVSRMVKRRADADDNIYYGRSGRPGDSDKF